MKRIIGILLIVASAYLAYVGVTQFSDSGKSVEVAGVELSAHNNEDRTNSFIYMGAALLTFVGGIALVRSK